MCVDILIHYGICCFVKVIYMIVYFLFCLLLFCIVHHEYDHERA